MRNQRTIKKEITFSGIGLHTGKEAFVTLKPAPRNSGIVFYRRDKHALIHANILNICDTAFATTLSYNGTKIRTVEHILSALSGLGIDNILIEVVGPEIPILDGSATLFVELILEAGIAKQSAQKQFIKIIRPFVYENNHTSIACFPSNELKISYSIDFNHNAIRHQEMTIEINEFTFAKDIAPARTFGFLKDVEALRANGLAKGGSLENAVVIGDSGVINPSGLRFSNEFVRHKILDTIGDFALAGYPLIGHFVLSRSGHHANTRFLAELLACRGCYKITTENAFTNESHFSEISIQTAQTQI
ncbi:MAG: UDP-3-O-acyl-N-acetylglucosamine deacetylase [Thermodesulfovibrionales bacterium]|nr:UDP-3-O-acyl-N-acetylglucosamine deacetylase [Thermodesulfovibrionales bacterium]